MAAERILTLSIESLDMMRGVTAVVKESLDRAEGWVERLRVVGLQRQQQQQSDSTNAEAPTPNVAARTSHVAPSPTSPTESSSPPWSSPTSSTSSSWATASESNGLGGLTGNREGEGDRSTNVTPKSRRRSLPAEEEVGDGRGGPEPGESSKMEVDV